MSVGPIELREVPFVKGAITLWPFILYGRGVYSDCVRAHEYVHWQDALGMGVLPYYIKYLYLALVKGYGFGREHPMERLAYRVEEECLKGILGYSKGRK